MGHGPFKTWHEVGELARGFEAQTLLGEHDWTHRDHLAMAAYYCITDPACASERMRSGIQALNAARGVPQTPASGYHDTMTIAWIRIIGGHIAGLGDVYTVQKVNSVLESFADRRAPFKHYSKERIMSVEARYGWVEPDLEPLPQQV